MVDHCGGQSPSAVNRTNKHVYTPRGAVMSSHRHPHGSGVQWLANHGRRYHFNCSAAPAPGAFNLPESRVCCQNNADASI